MKIYVPEPFLAKKRLFNKEVFWDWKIYLNIFKFVTRKSTIFDFADEGKYVSRNNFFCGALLIQ